MKPVWLLKLDPGTLLLLLDCCRPSKIMYALYGLPSHQIESFHRLLSLAQKGRLEEVKRIYSLPENEPSRARIEKARVELWRLYGEVVKKRYSCEIEMKRLSNRE